MACAQVRSRCASKQRLQGCIDQQAGRRQRMRGCIPEILHRWHRPMRLCAGLLPCSLLGLEGPKCCFPAAFDSTCFCRDNRSANGPIFRFLIHVTQEISKSFLLGHGSHASAHVAFHC